MKPWWARVLMAAMAVDSWPHEGQENTVDGKLGFIDHDQYNGDSSHYHNYGSIPVPGSFPI